MNIPERFCASAIATTVIPLDEEKKVLPDSIQWMPPGRQNVMPIVNGEPMRLIFDVTPDIADAFNQQLQEMRTAAKAGEGDEPYIDFNHEDRERSGEVQELYWGGEDPKTGGIRARISWSRAGAAAVLGKDFRRFSPQWDFDPKTHKPLFINENLGGLVNRAAFKKIAQVIAKDGSAANHNQQKNMDIKDIEAALDKRFTPLETRLAALEKNIPAPTAAAKAGEQTTDIATAVAGAVSTALKPVIDRMDKVETDTKKASARAAIDPHIKRGAIAPQDADAISMWENAWLANAKSAEAQMAKLPGAKGGRITSPTTGAEGSTDNAEPQEAIVAKAMDLAGKSNGKLSYADALIATARSSEGADQYREFRKTFAVGAKRNN